MARNIVAAAGAHVEMGTDGRYKVTTWCRLEHGRHIEDWYDGLSWVEAIDVVIAEMDATRPGWQLGDGWRQPTLDSEVDDLLR